MSSLHKVIYQMVLDPRLLVEFIQAPREFGDSFNLTCGEVQALTAISSDYNNFQLLLSPETIKSSVQDVLEKVWVPPTYP